MSGQRRYWQKFSCFMKLVNAFLFLWCSGWTIAQAAGLSVTSMTVEGDELRSRFIAQLSSQAGYSVSVVPDPYRVIIDLPPANFGRATKTPYSPSGLVRSYHHQLVERGNARIVLQTVGPVLIERAYLAPTKNGKATQIIVDLVQTSSVNFYKNYVAEGRSTVSPHAAGERSPLSFPQMGSKKTSGKALRTIVIDPGHGGIDPGAVGHDGTQEKDVVLAFASVLRGKLEQTGKYQVIMTRAEDKFVSLRNRVKIARDHQADLFIALHADTVSANSVRGATLYTLSDKASDKEAEQLAQKENRADIIAGIDLDSENTEVTGILIDLAQRESKGYAALFAKKAYNRLGRFMNFTTKPLRSAGFVVLKAPDVPSILIELGYLSSKTDTALLNSGLWREKAAAALALGIEDYFVMKMVAIAGERLGEPQSEPSGKEN